MPFFPEVALDTPCLWWGWTVLGQREGWSGFLGAEQLDAVASGVGAQSSWGLGPALG